MGPVSRPHKPRTMESILVSHGHQSLHLQHETWTSANLSALRSTQRCSDGHRREQETQRALLRSLNSGHVQASGILQRHRVSVVRGCLVLSAYISEVRNLISNHAVLQNGCTLKEAAIIASVLSKKTIPSVHLGAAIINISKAEFSGKCTAGLRHRIAIFTTPLTQARGRFSSAFLLTRRRTCHIKSSTSLYSTSFECPMYARLVAVRMQISYLCFGIKAFLHSVSGSSSVILSFVGIQSWHSIC